jgi:hypothetical protein
MALLEHAVPSERRQVRTPAPAPRWICAKCGAVAGGIVAAGEHINLHTLNAPRHQRGPAPQARCSATGLGGRPPDLCATGGRPAGLSWFAARTRGAELDAILAESPDPGVLADSVSRRRCDARARLLVGRGFRHSLAAQIEEVLALVSGPGVAGTPSAVWSVDISLDELRRASPSMRLIVSRLEDAKPPRAQGVALAVLLLRDGRSPLYGSRAVGELELAAQATALSLASPVTRARGPASGGDPSSLAASRWWREPSAQTSGARRRRKGDA